MSDLYLLSLIFVSASFPLSVMLLLKFKGTHYGHALRGVSFALFYLIFYFGFKFVQDVPKAFSGLDISEIAQTLALLSVMYTAMEIARLFSK